MDIGKIPPQAIELEEAVLGALMIEKGALDTISDVLTSRMFYKESNQHIFTAIQELYNKSEPVDILTVTMKLRSQGTLESCGGPYYVTMLSNRVASAANIEFHARIIEQKFLQRELIRISQQIHREAYEDTADCYELIESVEREIASLTYSTTESKSWAEQVKEAREHIEKIDRESGVSGIASGIESVDCVLKGFQNGELIILGARPAMGKSALMVQFALNISKRGIPVDVYSLEMAGLQLILRALSSESKVEGDSLKSGKLSDQDWLNISRAESRLKELPIHLDDFPSQKPQSIRKKIKKGVKERGTKIVFIDYLQLMDASDANNKSNRDAQIGEISRTLKRIAKECNIPVFALASLSRQVEQRGGTKKPMLSDLRESGNIESDADVVGFLYRPEYYGFFTDEAGNSLSGIAEFIIAKNRNGAVNTCLMRFNGATSSFTDVHTTDFEIGAQRHFAEPPEKDNEPF